MRQAAIIGTHRQVQIAVCFIEQQRHPEYGDEARGHPGIVVITLGQLDINDTALVKLPESIAREVGRTGKPDVAASILID